CGSSRPRRPGAESTLPSGWWTATRKATPTRKSSFGRRSRPAMPELPEVEMLRRQLAPTLPGSTIAEAELRLPKLMTKWGGLGPEAFPGHRIEGISRRAKILRFQLSDGLTLLVHLKLSGQLVHRSATAA